MSKKRDAPGMTPLHRALIGVAGLALFGLLALKWVPRLFSDAPDAPPTTGGAKTGAPAITLNRAVNAPPPPAERSTLADGLNSPTADIRADLRIVNEVIQAFQTNFPRDGNPVGTNAEINAVLTGKNKLRLALIPPDHPAINQAGELCDRWGTPFFFHAESAKKMEIRSAGPDRKMWNDDDVVLSP